MPRWLELLMVCGLLSVALPVILLIMIVLKISGSQIWFYESRIGKNGKPFTIYKFRTMIPDAKNQVKVLLQCTEQQKQWQTKRKLTKDTRVTKIGFWLRRFSLDELPQFFNVIKGDMSFVGPRPITREEIKFYGNHAKIIQSVKPGITGLWQVSGRNEIAWPRRTVMNVLYAKKRSCCFDSLPSHNSLKLSF